MEHAQLKWIVTQDKELVHIDASFEPLVPKFLTNRKNEVMTMQEALTAQDFETVRVVAQGVNGAGGSYGFDRITEIAAGVEQAARTCDSSTIECHLPVLAPISTGSRWSTTDVFETRGTTHETHHPGRRR